MTTSRVAAPVLQQPELVVLLDPLGHSIGTAPKSTVHTASTPLHLAFSCHLVDDDGRMMGIDLVLPDFSYRAVDASGIVEHERCPVFVGRIVGDPQPDPDEVVEWRWTEPERLRTAIAAAPWAFSPWLVLQAEQLPLLAGAA